MVKALLFKTALEGGGIRRASRWRTEEASRMERAVEMEKGMHSGRMK